MKLNDLLREDDDDDLEGMLSKHKNLKLNYFKHLFFDAYDIDHNGGDVKVPEQLDDLQDRLAAGGTDDYKKGFDWWPPLLIAAYHLDIENMKDLRGTNREAVTDIGDGEEDDKFDMMDDMWEHETDIPRFAADRTGAYELGKLAGAPAVRFEYMGDPYYFVDKKDLQ